MPKFHCPVLGLAPALAMFLSLMPFTAHANDLIHLPQDDARHPGYANMPERWYYNGHIATKSGHHYGYELVFFQAAELGIPTRAVQFAITDIDSPGFRYHTWIFPGAYPVVKDGFKLEIPLGPTAAGGDGIDHLHAALPDGTTLDLDLKPLKRPTLEHGDGVISGVDPTTGAAIADELYYSRTRVESSGTLKQNGVTEKVGGLSWFDHEWGKLNRAAWVWYSIQLDNGQEIMAYDMFEKAGGPPVFFGAEVMGTCFDCGNLVVGPKEFSMPYSGSWKSPHTGKTYPTNFNFEIPTADTKLEITPVMQDQEISGSILQPYWEGPVTVTGVEYGHPVKGTGYIELTGF